MLEVTQLLTVNMSWYSMYWGNRNIKCTEGNIFTYLFHTLHINSTPSLQTF